MATLEQQLASEVPNEYSGTFHIDSTTRKLYSTDASVYQEMPIAVAIPRTCGDVKLLIELANRNQIGLIPRTAGTSLAGQVVGNGIVVDVSRHLTEIVEINPAEKWVRVQPGVIRNELNMALRPHGLLFGPETSTANRAMIGGMLGNNSCGSNSLVYGSVRDKVVEVFGYLSDGSKADFGPLDKESLQQKLTSPTNSLEAEIYRGLYALFNDPNNQATIQANFPEKSVTRRNTGYALDWLAETDVFGDYSKKFNVANLIAGSEGTLFLATEIKLSCDDLPPPFSGVLCAHFNSVDDALRANICANKFQPSACELIDRFILAGATRNPEQRRNMNFIQGSPEAVLLIEFRADNRLDLQQKFTDLIDVLQTEKLGYEFPVFENDDAKPVWEVRKAGLGVAANVVGDAKPVTVIEDTAVAIDKLPEYIRDLNQILSEYQTECVHYGHAGSGELHLRPVLNLKTDSGREKFARIAQDVAKLVKKYNGSLSGEHGDGRLRSQFLKEMLGDECYQLITNVKELFDPDHIFNPGKIVDPPPILNSLRYPLTKQKRGRGNDLPTTFDFTSTNGLLGAAEMCSGSGDCRKTALTGGIMCPSYMATRDEKDSTRARANILRQLLADSESVNRNSLAEVLDVMDLCLSCKGCKRECPSNVDVAKMKAEVTHSYHRMNGIPLRSRLIAGIASTSKWSSKFPGLYNLLVSNRVTGSVIKKILGFHLNRSMPTHGTTSLRNWFKYHQSIKSDSKVFLFCDEFTNYFDPEIGIATVQLLEKLGYEVQIVDHSESGRASISKGVLDHARNMAIQNVSNFSEIVTRDSPLIGIEPSAILTFRDEYIDLVPDNLRSQAQSLSSNCLLLDEFITREFNSKNILRAQFSDAAATIRLHGHCHQKSLGSMATLVHMLQIPQNYQVKLIPSGCCGMAGSFGFNKRHYDVSMKVGELVLFPTIRNEPADSIIVAPGTSCRHQILDGTGRSALHPAQVLLAAMKPDN